VLPCATELLGPGISWNTVPGVALAGPATVFVTGLSPAVCRICWAVDAESLRTSGTVTAPPET